MRRRRIATNATRAVPNSASDADAGSGTVVAVNVSDVLSVIEMAGPLPAVSKVPPPKFGNRFPPVSVMGPRGVVKKYVSKAVF